MNVAAKIAAPPFTARPLSDVLGAEVTDFDVRTLREPDAVEATKRLLRDAQVLVFRNQTLTEREMVEVIGRFGEPQYHVLNQFLLPDTPEIYILSNVKEDGQAIGNAYEGISWHTDLKGQKSPTAYTVLYGIEIPEVGGSTCFASMYKAFEAMPEERRREIDGRNLIYNYGRQYNTRLKVLAERGITDHQYDKPLTPQQQAYAKERHPYPIVDVNPHNGRKWLHLATMGCAGVEGMDDDDGVKLVEDLVTWATSPRFRYDHQWRVGDLLIWDNRGLFHMAGDYDKSRYRRLIWRCSIGEPEPKVTLATAS